MQTQGGARLAVVAEMRLRTVGHLHVQRAYLQPLKQAEDSARRGGCVVGQAC
jgi:hypothetical protein